MKRNIKGVNLVNEACVTVKMIDAEDEAQGLSMKSCSALVVCVSVFTLFVLESIHCETNNKVLDVLHM